MKMNDLDQLQSAWPGEWKATPLGMWYRPVPFNQGELIVYRDDADAKWTVRWKWRGIFIAVFNHDLNVARCELRNKVAEFCAELNAVIEKDLGPDGVWVVEPEVDPAMVAAELAEQSRLLQEAWPGVEWTGNVGKVGDGSLYLDLCTTASGQACCVVRPGSPLARGHLDHCGQGDTQAEAVAEARRKAVERGVET